MTDSSVNSGNKAGPEAIVPDGETAEARSRPSEAVLSPQVLTAAVLICAMAAARIVLPPLIWPFSPGFGRLAVTAIVFAGIPWAICGSTFLRRCLSPVPWVLVLAGAAAGLANYLPVLAISRASAELLGLAPQNAAALFTEIPRFELAALVLTVAAAAPLAEELALRGTVQPLLCARFCRIPGVVLTALIFALLHFELASLAALAEMGIVFGLLAVGSKSIWPAAAAHAAHNLTALVLLATEQAGAPLSWMRWTSGAENWPSIAAALASACLTAVFIRCVWRGRQRQDEPHGGGS